MSLFLKYRVEFVAIILAFLVLAFSSPSLNYLGDSRCKAGDPRIAIFIKNILGLPAHAQTCDWTATQVCVFAVSGPKKLPSVKSRTTFSWPAYTPSCGTTVYSLAVTGTGGGTFPGLTTTSRTVDLNPNTNYNWTVNAQENLQAGRSSCQNVGNVTPQAPGPQPFTSLECSGPGSFTLSQGATPCNSVGLTWTAAADAGGYRVLKGAPQIVIATTTALSYTDYDVTENSSHAYQIESFNDFGTKFSNSLNITTPYCPPTVSLKFNSSSGPVTIAAGSSGTLSWASSGATSCVASGGIGSWPGSKTLSGSQSIGPVNSSTVFNLECSGLGGTTPVSVTVNTTGFPPPAWIEIHP